MIGVMMKIEEDNIKEVQRTAEENVKTALTHIGRAMQNNGIYEITVLGAVKTGNLRNSITYTDNGKDQVSVGTDVSYAKYVEYGTSKRPARPFLKNAVANHQEEYLKLLEVAMRNG